MYRRFQNSALHRVPTIAAAAAMFSFAPPGAADAATLKTLHSFCTETGCGDGETPEAGLLMDASGNLYGTTEDGGKYGDGLLFKLIPNAKKTKYTEHIIKNFCKQANCPDGAFPEGALIMDVNGNLYGTTTGGGKYTEGAIFKMRPVTNGWVFSVIHSFCAENNCTDGDGPYTGLAYAGQASGAPWDGTSPLFGTTDGGGTNNKGTAYEISPSGSGWSYDVIHNFNAPSFDSTAFPGSLLVDSSGNVFGVTGEGGKYGVGVLYELAAGTWTETVLHNFTESTGQVGWGRLAMDGAGNLFGVTLYGGSGSGCAETVGCGVAFERTAGGKYKVLYNFCSLNHCKDGFDPYSLVMDTAGNLVGTTSYGGTGGKKAGTVFKLNRGNNWSETVLYDFCSESSCSDGEQPYAPVIMDDKDNVYGTTSAEGANGNGGTVFELTP